MPEAAPEDQAAPVGDRLHAAAPIGWGVWLLVLLLAPLVVIEIRNALARPFWSDEVCTAIMAMLASPSKIWEALARSADTQPPFFFLLTAFGNRLVTDQHLAFRLPALVGFFCVPVCLYLFVARRAGVMAGLIASLVPMMTSFQTYASEARPYGFELGCVAAGLLFWQRLERSRGYAVPLALALAAAVASHYYALIAIGAIFVGEFVRLIRTREIRWSAWIPFAIAVTPFVVGLPLMKAIREYYGEHFWAHNSMQGLFLSYAALTGLGTSMTIGVIAVLWVILIVKMFATEKRFKPEECAVAAFWLLLPAFVSVILIVAHGGLVPRYVMSMVLGLAVAAGVVAGNVKPQAAATVLAVLLVNHAFGLMNHGLSVFRGQSRSPVANSMATVLQDFVREFPVSQPIVVSSATDYLTLNFYSGPEIKSRMLALVDPPEAVRAIGTDSGDLEVMALKQFTPINIQPFSKFRREHQHFLMFSTSNSFDWWPERLSHDGHTVVLRRAEGPYQLYEVQLQP
jgi:hypothetical protein